MRGALLWDRMMEMLFFHDVNNKVPLTPLLLQLEHITATESANKRRDRCPQTHTHTHTL